MSLFDDAIFDEAIFDTDDLLARVRNRRRRRSISDADYQYVAITGDLRRGRK